jgi:hypothetical protein
MIITETKKSTLTQSELNQFTGTTTYYKHFIKPYIYTDGIQYFAEKGECYWLLDKIFSLQTIKQIKNDDALQHLQFWRLKVNEDKSALLTCERDLNDIAYTETLTYTDFPLSEILLYFQNNVLHLPSEY